MHFTFFVLNPEGLNEVKQRKLQRTKRSILMSRRRINEHILFKINKI